MSVCEKSSCILLSVNMFRLLNCINANHVIPSLCVPCGFLLLMMDWPSHSAGNNLRYVTFICFCCYKKDKQLASINRADTQWLPSYFQCHLNWVLTDCPGITNTEIVQKQDATQATLFPEGLRSILHGSVHRCGVVSRAMIESVLLVWLVSRSRIDVRVNVSAV